jgi:hypothetical protein
VAEGLLDEREFEKQVSDIHAEGKRQKDHSFYISPTYDYSPTFEDFRDEELFIKKKSFVSTVNYLTWLRETKKTYKNARHYYTLWGARGTGIDKGATYDRILALIVRQPKKLSPNTIKAQKSFSKILTSGFQPFIVLNLPNKSEIRFE